jgi:hypothetical protein
LGAVGQHAHDRVGNGVKHAQRQEQRPDQRGRQSKDIGIEKVKKFMIRQVMTVPPASPRP